MSLIVVPSLRSSSNTPTSDYGYHGSNLSVIAFLYAFKLKIVMDNLKKVAFIEEKVWISAKSQASIINDITQKYQEQSEL